MISAKSFKGAHVAVLTLLVGGLVQAAHCPVPVEPMASADCAVVGEVVLRFGLPEWEMALVRVYRGTQGCRAPLRFVGSDPAPNSGFGTPGLVSVMYLECGRAFCETDACSGNRALGGVEDIASDPRFLPAIYWGWVVCVVPLVLGVFSLWRIGLARRAVRLRTCRM